MRANFFKSKMLNKSAKAALLAGRGLSASAAAQAAPALATAPKSKGFLSGLFGSDDRLAVSMSDPWPGLVLPEHAPPPKEAPKTQMTTLANGFKVASENTLVSAASCSAVPAETIAIECERLGRPPGAPDAPR
jgi:hypothetical protein